MNEDSKDAISAPTMGSSTENTKKKEEKKVEGEQPEGKKRKKAVIKKAVKSVANFRLREGMPIGCVTTLRGERMYEFLDRLVAIAIPRIRDFRGLSPKSFDGRGNYAMGVTEQIIFPEIDYDKIDTLRGMDITITTTAKTDNEGRALLKAMQFPFRADPSQQAASA